MSPFTTHNHDSFPDHSEIISDSDENISLSPSSSDITTDTICEEMVDNIFCEEEDFVDSEKQQDGYYIGISSLSNDTGHIIYANSVQCSTFFRYDLFYICYYLHEYSIFNTHSVEDVNINIMKLFILDDCYTVIIKTHWLRIIQRHWKNTHSIRKNILKIRASPTAICFFEKNGRYPENCGTMPSIRGMLSCYK